MACLAGCETGSGSPDGGKAVGTDSARIACVDRINAFRATESLPPLARWTGAEDCSDGEAKSDANSGKAHGAFGTCKEMAQNECPGWGSVQSTITGCLQSMWDERLKPSGEQGHYRNMRNTKYTQVACGFHETAEGKVWALQNFR
jgi:hypothetical protein